jgi:PGF-CTERM protein
VGKARQFAVAVVVGALLIQAAAVGVTAQSTERAADDAYVSDDGDVVLVYESEPSGEDPETVEFGANVAENLVYGLVTDSVEGTPDVRWQFAGNATRTAMRAEGGLSLPSPEAVRDFALDVSSETTEATAASDVSLATTFADESGMSGFVNSVATSGNVTMTADRLTATAGLDVNANVPLGQRESLRASISSENGDYELAVDWSRLVPQRQAEQWRNRDNAQRLLRAQYQGIAESLGGSASVEIDSISVSPEDAGYRLEQAYSVELSEIDSGIESMVRTALAEDPQFSDGQADRLANAIAAMDLRDLSIDYTLDAGDLTGEVTVDVRGYDELALGYVEILQATGAGNVSDMLDRARAQIEAQQAADLEQRFSWTGTLSHPESGVVRAEFEAESRAENWADYVDEVQNREIPFTSQNFRLTGDLADGRLAFDGSASMAGEHLFEQFTQGFPTGEDVPGESAAVFESIEASNPEKAKVTGSYDSDGLRIEAGAAFGDLSRIRDALAENADAPRFSEVVGRANETGGESIVRVSGAVSGQATETDVRALAGVAERTTVHLPGEWDRTFPSMDVDRARNYLSDVGTGSAGPGFGPIVALVAILVAAGLLGRRRQ